MDYKQTDILLLLAPHSCTDTFMHVIMSEILQCRYVKINITIV